LSSFLTCTRVQGEAHKHCLGGASGFAPTEFPSDALVDTTNLFKDTSSGRRRAVNANPAGALNVG
jgi:hypothetical protein